MKSIHLAPAMLLCTILVGYPRISASAVDPGFTFVRGCHDQTIRYGAQLVDARCRGKDGEAWLGIGTKLIPVAYAEPALGRCVLQGVTLRMIVGSAFGLNLNKTV